MPYRRRRQHPQHPQQHQRVKPGLRPPLTGPAHSTRLQFSPSVAGFPPVVSSARESCRGRRPVGGISQIGPKRRGCGRGRRAVAVAVAVAVGIMEESVRNYNFLLRVLAANELFD